MRCMRQCLARHTFCLPYLLIRNLEARNYRSIQRFLCVARVGGGRVPIRIRACCDLQWESTELTTWAFHGHRAFNPMPISFIFNTQVSKAFHGRVENQGCHQYFRRIFSRGTLDPDAPASSMLSTRDLDKFGGDVNRVSRVMDYLPSAMSDIVFIPAITMHSFILFACMPEVWYRVVSRFLWRRSLGNIGLNQSGMSYYVVRSRSCRPWPIVDR